jgi:hypothetical protein
MWGGDRRGVRAEITLRRNFGGREFYPCHFQWARASSGMPSQRVWRAGYQVRGLGFWGLTVWVLKMAAFADFWMSVAQPSLLRWQNRARSLLAMPNEGQWTIGYQVRGLGLYWWRDESWVREFSSLAVGVCGRGDDLQCNHGAHSLLGGGFTSYFVVSVGFTEVKAFCLVIACIQHCMS